MRLSDVISKDELRRLSALSNARALVDLAWHLALFVAAFALPIWAPHPVTMAISIILLAGRMQASGVIAHDCAHGALFRTPYLNQVVGQWIAGAPIHLPLDAYRAYHLQHHRHAGTAQDPDRWMVKDYPIARARLWRKIGRDLTGQTALRDLALEAKRFAWPHSAPFVAFHVGLFALLWALGAPWAYGLWWAARLFIYPAIHRLRQISEHGTAPNRDSLDARDNTATTRVAWWEQLVLAPNNVNYHLEHHLFAAVPSYRLARLHKLLSARGFYDGRPCVNAGYAGVLQRALRNDKAVAA